MNSQSDASDLTRTLLAWYADAQRDLPWRRTGDPYAVWISEVMLQQTLVKTVIPYYLRFMGLFPTVDHLARTDLQQVLKVWEGLGYYSRCRNLHHTARMITDQWKGCLPDQWDALRRLPGIGDYIAAAVLSIAFQKPFAVVDGNVKRVLARLHTLAEPVNRSGSHKFYQQWADRLLDHRRPGDFNQAMMELGALVCTPRRPLCLQCPLKSFCQAQALGVVDAYPLRAQRPPVPNKKLAAAAVRKGDRLLLTQRPSRGLLGGLWELPTIMLTSGQDPMEACGRMIKECLNLDVTLNGLITTVAHAYTHFKIRMAVYDCRWRRGRVILDGPADFAWIRAEQVDQYPLHKSMVKAWPAIIKFQSE